MSTKPAADPFGFELDSLAADLVSVEDALQTVADTVASGECDFAQAEAEYVASAMDYLREDVEFLHSSIGFAEEEIGRLEKALEDLDSDLRALQVAAADIGADPPWGMEHATTDAHTDGASAISGVCARASDAETEADGIVVQGEQLVSEARSVASSCS